MKRREAFFKKILAIGISIGLSIGSLGILSSCGQKEQPNTPTPPPIVEVDPDLGGESNGGENSGTENQETKIDVASVVNEYFGDINFANEFNLALIDLVAKKVDIEDVKDIEIVSFDKDVEGKIVLNVIYEEGAEKESDQLTYEGDTTKFVNFYNLSSNSMGIINGVVTENGLTLDGKVVEASSVHTALEEDFAELLATYNAEKTAFGAISAEDISVKEDEKPVEYISVQSIVDDIFKDVDFDGDTKEVMETLVATKSPALQVKKSFALDYKIAADGTISVFAECKNTRNGMVLLTSFTVNDDTSKFEDFLLLSGDFNKEITRVLQEKGLTLEGSVDKNAAATASLIAELAEMKVQYEQQRTSLKSTPKENITAKTLFTPLIVTPEKSVAMGTTDLNDFAKALLTNDNGENYDSVTGWTIDDVVATYISEFGDEMIDNSSTMDMVVVTKQGILQYQLWTKRYVGDVTTDRHAMILADNQNAGVNKQTTLAEYADNAIVFDADGERIVEEPEVEATALYAGGRIIGFFDNKGNVRII